MCNRTAIYLLKSCRSGSLIAPRGSLFFLSAFHLWQQFMGQHCPVTQACSLMRRGLTAQHCWSWDEHNEHERDPDALKAVGLDGPLVFCWKLLMGCTWSWFVPGHMLSPSSSIYNDHQFVAGFCSVQTHCEKGCGVFARPSLWTLIFLPGDKGVVSLSPLSLVSLQNQQRQGRGFDLSFVLLVARVNVVCNLCVVAPQQRQQVADVQPWGNSCSLRRLHTAASPDPMSEPTGSLRLSLVVRKTEREIPGR